MQVAGQLGHLRIGGNQIIRELGWMRRRKPNPLDAGHLSRVVDEQCQVGGCAIGHRPAIGIDVLAQEGNFPHALLGQLGHLGEHVVQRTTDLLAAGVGHDAEGAVLAAAFHHRHEGRRPFRTRLGQVVEFFDLGEGDVHHRAALGTRLVDHLGQAVHRLRAEHQIHIRRTVRDGVAFLGRHTATHADQQPRIAILERPQAAQLGEHFLLGLLTHRTGVEQQHIGLVGIVSAVQLM